MKFTTIVASFLLAAAPAIAAVNGPCTNANGICLDKNYCTSSSVHGRVVGDGFCPNDPNNVKCCYINPCGPTGRRISSVCKWTSQSCSGEGQYWLKNKCPGPDNFKCCVTDNS